MHATALLTGFFAAHAVWSVSDGETLIPIYAYVDPDGKRHMNRLAYDRLEMAVEAGHKRLELNPDKAQCAVLVCDGYIPVEGARTDALLIEAHDFAVNQRVTMGIPYVPVGESTSFKVYRPKILAFPESANSEAFIEQFWAGVDGHEHGSKVWDSHLDESK